MSDVAPVPPPPKRKARLLTRRNFLALTGLAVAGLPSYSLAYEPFRFDVTRTKIPVAAPKLRRPIRVLHLSDLHASRAFPLANVARGIGLGIAQKPDLIVLTGDYVTGRDMKDWTGYADILRTLAAEAPTYAVLGNHDRSCSVCEETRAIGPLIDCLAHAGVQLLLNSSARVTLTGGQTVSLIGVGDLWSEACRPEVAARSLPVRAGVDEPVIALAHNPDSKAQMLDLPWDLLCCGHTHGGQVKLPLVGALTLPIHDRSCAEGLVDYRGRHVYVTRGVGNLMGIRFNCPPEVSVLELTPREA